MSNHEETLKQLYNQGFQNPDNSMVDEYVIKQFELFLLQKLEANDKEWEERIRRCGVGDKEICIPIKEKEETGIVEAILSGFNSANHQWRERILKETGIDISK